MGSISELKFMSPKIFIPNTQTHYIFPHKFQIVNFHSKTSILYLKQIFPSKIQQWHSVLQPCLAADSGDFPSSLSASSDDTKSEESEQNPEKVAEQKKDRRRAVRIAWEKLVRWSRSLRSKSKHDVLQRTQKVVVLGGGSFGTAMAAHVADRKSGMVVNMLVRDPQVCQTINESHFNCKYFPNHKLPENLTATTDAKSALQGADFCLHAVPVQFTASFLGSIVDYVDPGLPFISLSKGLELNTLRMMSQIIPQALRNPRQPFVALSGPSFAKELMRKLPTAMVVASKDKKLANEVQQLLASERLRINTSSDVTGVEIAGALKNVLAIAAGIVEGMNLGNNSMAALVAQKSVG